MHERSDISSMHAMYSSFTAERIMQEYLPVAQDVCIGLEPLSNVARQLLVSVWEIIHNII